MERKIRALSASYIKTGIIALAALILFILVYRHTPGLNGPWYWKWSWRRVGGVNLYLFMLAGFIPFLIAQFLYHKKKINLPGALLLIMLSTFSLEMIAIGMQSASFDFTRIGKIVENPVSTSYFTDALNVANVKQFLGSFHQSLDSFHLHARNKPPGSILYYVLFLHLFKYQHTAALVGGIFIGILATLTIPATYFLTNILGNNRNAAFNAASYISLTPALVLFFPEFDQVLPILTCLSLGFWVLALEKDRKRYSLLFGFMLSVTIFITWNLLVLGVFLSAYTLYFLFRPESKRYPSVIKHLFIAIIVLFIVYLGLWGISGYNPIATFLKSVSMQKENVANLNVARPYPHTVYFDITDFALGSGWISALLALFFMIRKIRNKMWDRELRMSCFCLAQILVVAAGAFIPAETARVWIFMLPLLLFPVGLEMCELNFKSRIVVYFLLLGLSTVICQNMLFIRA